MCGVIAHRRVCIPALRDGTTLPSEEWPWTPLSCITLAVPFAKIEDRMASPCLPVAERGTCRGSLTGRSVKELQGQTFRAMTFRDKMFF